MSDPKQPEDVPAFDELLDGMSKLEKELQEELPALYPGTPVMVKDPGLGSMFRGRVVRVNDDGMVVVHPEGPVKAPVVTVPRSSLSIREDNG